MTPFMDHAEEVGLRPLLALLASHYSGRDALYVSPCACGHTVGDAWRSRLSMTKTHDTDCPLHRVVVLCGDPADKQALVDKAHEFALEALRIVAEPARETGEDHEYAKRIVGVAR